MSEISIPNSKWTATRPLWIGFLAMLVLVFVLGGWGIFARISGAVIASGLVQVENNRQVIQHPLGGVVGEILAKDGDRVTAGQIVLRLDTTLLDSELAIIQGQLFEIQARQVRLQAERDGLDKMALSKPLVEERSASAEFQELIAGQTRLFEARKESLQRESEQLAEQILQTRNEILGTQAQLVALEKQRRLVDTEILDSEFLYEKGLAQASRLSSLRREEARLSGEIGSLNAGTAQLKGQIAALEIQKLKLVTLRREEAIGRLRDLQFQEIELRERGISLRDTLAKMKIRSPSSGVVYGSQVFAIQSVISAAQPIMYVIPQDQRLIVSARVEAIHVDQVQIGQDVTLRFAAFDQRQTPELSGRVSNLSADVFLDETSGMSFYQAEIILEEGELDKLGAQELLPGMPVDAFIKTGDRSPISYLTKPLTDYFTKSLRET